MTTYVFGSLEVRLTGREATRNKKRRNKQPDIETLIEIEPVDENGPQWKQWVRLTELYEVTTQPVPPGDE